MLKKATDKVQKNQNSVERCQSDFRWTKAVIKYEKANQQKMVETTNKRRLVSGKYTSQNNSIHADTRNVNKFIAAKTSE